MTAFNMTHQFAILGSYPPPYTGVTTHIERLCGLLAQRGVDYVVYNATSDAEDGPRVKSVYRSRRRWLLGYALRGRERGALLFSDRLSAWIAGAFMGAVRGKKVILRLRNSALPDALRGAWWRRWLCRVALRRMWAVVCVNRALLAAAAEAGVPADRLLWCPGFLPPRDDATQRTGVDPTVWTFVDAHAPIIAANGKVNWYRGEDLYGLDLLVELAARLRQDFPNVGIVVCFWDHHAQDDAYLDRLRARAAELGVADNILFNTARGRFLPVLAAADLFLRPTNTDGDANSIREAQYLGVPVLASDAVERPEGTRLFASRDAGDLERGVRAAFAEDHLSPRRRAVLSDEARACIEAYLDLLAEAASPDEHPRTAPRLPRRMTAP